MTSGSSSSAVPRFLERFIDVLILAAGWWLIVLSFASCIEMVTRKLFAYSLQGIDEVGGYTLAVVAAVGFSATLLTRGHTRIDFLVGKLPVRVRSVLNWFAIVTLALMALFAVWRGWTVLDESIEFQSHATTPLQTPMWLPQSMWLLGWGLFGLTAAILAVDATRLLLRGDHDAVNAAYGPQTLDEEIESEAGELLKAARAEGERMASEPAPR